MILLSLLLSDVLKKVFFLDFTVTLPSLLLINLSFCDLVTHLVCMFVSLCFIGGIYEMQQKGTVSFHRLLFGSWILSSQVEAITVLICHHRLCSGTCPQFLTPLQCSGHHF